MSWGPSAIGLFEGKLWNSTEGRKGEFKLAKVLHKKGPGGIGIRGMGAKKVGGRVGSWYPLCKREGGGALRD